MFGWPGQDVENGTVTNHQGEFGVTVNVSASNYAEAKAIGEARIHEIVRAKLGISTGYHLQHCYAQ